MRIGTSPAEFLWAVGIEDTFIPQVATSTGRTLDEYELTQHYRYWREDLQRAASLGVRAMRYGIPWYKVNPEPGVFDWSWTDEVLEYMVRDLHIQPIVDLVHYGCPLWLEREFVNPAYPERVAEYARAFVERYRDLTVYYTPLNEPWMNTYLCGYTATWPPYLRGWRGWTRVMLALARGMSLTIAAIRELQPDAAIVHVEATSSFVAGDLAVTPDDVAFWWDRRFLATDLLLGRVDDRHPLTPWLLENGAPAEELAWLRSHPQAIDVMGCNFYPGLNVWKVVREDGRAVRRRYYGGRAEMETVVRRYHERYGKPIMLTETSTPGPVRRRERWMDESLALVRDLRSAGLPLIGYTWWPMFSLVGWQYRRGRKMLGAYLAHMGLWDLRDDGAGTLVRERTPLVDRFAAYVADSARTVGALTDTVVPSA